MCSCRCYAHKGSEASDKANMLRPHSCSLSVQVELICTCRFWSYEVIIATDKAQTSILQSIYWEDLPRRISHIQVCKGSTQAG